MTLEACSVLHAAQIEAGVAGRRRGHDFEKRLAAELHGLTFPTVPPVRVENRHLVWDSPASALLRYVAATEGWSQGKVERCDWLGGLATSREGDVRLGPSGLAIGRSKSDVVMDIRIGRTLHQVGVSVKTCSNASPTNAQLYCSTACAFCGLLRRNGIPVSEKAEQALQMFCGDPGFRPLDHGLGKHTGRLASNERWFWEELAPVGRRTWEQLLQDRHAEVFTVLLRNAYLDDPIPPAYVMHIRCRSECWDQTPLALFSVDELVNLSVRYKGFETRPYQVKKGRFKGDPAIHLAPRFGIVQFQPLGNTQNRNQLQFNLQAGYFTKLPYGG